MISIACDHGGYELKLEVIEHLNSLGHTVIDNGCEGTASCDYPIYAKSVTDDINEKKADLGILICGTGIGMSMAANKVEGIRAALCHDVFSAKATREHNNANILCMGARVVGPGLALMIVDTFLETPFSNEERHIRRISMYS
ncbi:MAG: ribose 5-phosphate isomerase B [Eubacterium sp.]|nr:ribose 5-phosphate isomerase B [Eubacterium sp.]